MGQQQLLLVILVTIIVGIATVVAITAFGTTSDSANIDAVRQDVAQLASAAQGYYLKPRMLGGGGTSFDNINFRNTAFAHNGIGTGDTPMVAWNENGKYVISVSSSGGAINVIAHPASQITGILEDSSEPADASETLGARIEVSTMCWGEQTPPSSCGD